jgi:hypothetical protein
MPYVPLRPKHQFFAGVPHRVLDLTWPTGCRFSVALPPHSRHWSFGHNVSPDRPAVSVWPQQCEDLLYFIQSFRPLFSHPHNRESVFKTTCTRLSLRLISPQPMYPPYQPSGKLLFLHPEQHIIIHARFFCRYVQASKPNRKYLLFDEASRSVLVTTLVIFTTYLSFTVWP